MLPWTHPSPCPKRRLDRFSLSCRAHDCAIQTDRQTDRQTTLLDQSLTIDRIYVVLRRSLIIVTTFDGTADDEGRLLRDC